MTQAQMEQRIKQWTGDKTADYGALCNDLAQLKLQKVTASTRSLGAIYVATFGFTEYCLSGLGITFQPKFTVITVNPGKLLTSVLLSGRYRRGAAAVSRGSSSH